MEKRYYLLDQPTPDTLMEWAWQAMIASFGTGEPIHEVWGSVLEYIGWLDELPVEVQA